MSITTGSFVQSANDLRAFGGGFDVRATASPAAPVRDMRAALASAPGLHPADFRVVASESTLAVKARQVGTTAKAETYAVHGVDAPFLQNTTYQFSAKASGYATSAAVWHALRTQPGLAVVDPFVAPRKSNYNFAAPPKFHLRGFYVEDKTFAPIPVQVRDPQSGREVTLKVIGVLSDNVPLSMTGIWTSQRTLSATFGARVQPTTYLYALRAGVDPKATAKHLESAFLANGMQADALKDVLRDTVSANLTFDRLIMGFMGLGLIVGVAALGVISARSVVERRQQIGVLRSIGFRRTHGRGDLPARVGVRGVDLDPGGDAPRHHRRPQRHRRLPAPGHVRQPRDARAVGHTRRSSSQPCSRSRWRRRWSRHVAPPASTPPRRSATSKRRLSGRIQSRRPVARVVRTGYQRDLKPGR